MVEASAREREARFVHADERGFAAGIFADLRERMMNRVVHLPLSAVESAGTGDLVARLGPFPALPEA